MQTQNTAIAVFKTHETTEAAVKKLFQAGFDIKNLSIIGKGFHTEENIVGFYNLGDRVKFWGLNGAFWGGLWGLFFGGVIVTLPIIGHVIILGYLASALISTVEGALLVGGVSAVSAVLLGIGIPKNSVIQYEVDVKANGFLVMAHGPLAEMLRARSILSLAFSKTEKRSDEELSNIAIYPSNKTEPSQIMNAEKLVMQVQDTL